MKIAHAADIREIDRRTAGEFGLPTIVLMENAGAAVIEAMIVRDKCWKSRRYLVVAGSGNNGGDGAVIARRLFCLGCRVTFLPAADLSRAKGDAAVQFEVLRRYGVRFAEENDFRSEIAASDVIVDAIYGTGYHGELPQRVGEIVGEINRSGKRIVAVDLPSGLYADGGMAGMAVHADLTVTLGLPKPGLVDFPGKEYAGERVVDPIGIPPALLGDDALRWNLVTAETASALFPARRRNTHKGNYGHLLAIGGFGSEHATMPGAVIMAGLASLRAGAGLLTVAVPEEAVSAVNGSFPEAMTLGLPYGDAERSVAALMELLEKRKIRTVLAGNGFGTGEYQAALLSALFRAPGVKQLVLDAGALTSLAGSGELTAELKASGKQTVITPHMGELSVLIGRKTEEIRRDRAAAAFEASAKTGAVVVQKDAVTFVSVGTRIFVIEAGSAALAKGGSGDVLAGLIAGFAASGMEMPDAAILGSYVLGRAGELYESRFEDTSAIAREVIALVPEALSAIRKGER
jgi:NAD(P)H-hydrate epimerase